MQGHRVATVDELKQPGDFCFWHIAEDGQSAFMAFKCPCGADQCRKRTHDSIPVRVGAPQPDQHNWGWDGNLDAPTLTPSIHRTGDCGWHGHLQAGMWRSV